MTRKQFLKTLGVAGAAAIAVPNGALAATAPAFRSRRTVSEYLGELDSPPEAVFPLLCPVREYEWLEGWKGEMIYSDSGVAEENCIFRTPPGPSIWNVDRYEPPGRIEFTVVSPAQVCRLNLTLERTAAGGTKLMWQRIVTGLTDEGNATLPSSSTEGDRARTQALDYFLKTGKMAHGI